MAREYAQVRLAIWGDDDFRALSPRAQHLYLTLLTSPSLSHCGVGDWRPKRIAALAAGWSAGEVEEAAAELVGKLFIVVDEDTEEVLVRSFLRHDGLMKQPKMATAMASAHAAVASTVLRRVIVHELQRLKQDHPELKGWGSEKASELLSKESVDPSTYPLGKGSAEGSENGSDEGSGKGSVKGSDKGSGEGSGKGKPTPSGKGSEKGCPTPAPAPTPGNQHLSSSLRSEGAEAPREIDAGTIVAAWVEAFEAATDRKPPKGLRGQAGKEARQLLDSGADPALVLDAARSAGDKGFATLEREYSPLAAKNRKRLTVVEDEINPDDILGPDYWSPPTPPIEIEEGPPDKRREWFRQASEEHRAERMAQAKAALAERRTA